MALGTWWRGDALPELSPLQSLYVHISTERALIAQMNNLNEQEVNTRLRNGNYAYIAFLNETPVAYGWLATQGAGVSEIQLAFTLPPANCYLWDFQTLPEWRGHGVYSHFLQAIVKQQRESFERFWILYKPGEFAAEKSIGRAGFQFLGKLELTQGRVSGFVPFEVSERARVGANVLDLPMVRNRESS